MTGTPVSIILDTGQGNCLLLVPSPQSGGSWPWASDVGLISFSQLTPYAGGCYLYLVAPTAYRSFQARDQSCAMAVTWATAVTMLAP